MGAKSNNRYKTFNFLNSRRNIRNKNLFLTFVKISAMLSDFENYIKENNLFSKDHKLMLAISGGQDSICLFYLLLKSGYQFSVAHCNFQLRGEDSQLDEAFVRQICTENSITCHVKSFETKKEAKKHKLGTQEIARKLRYDWFDEIKTQENYDFILTAHHQSDNTETILINLLRSTGVSGLHGIQNVNGYIIRPLLFADRTQISNYLSANNLSFRHDSSNDGNDYLRNKIRHHVIPELMAIEPNIDQVFSSVSRNISDFENLSSNLLSNHWKQFVSENNGVYFIPDSSFISLENPSILMYYWLKNYGFNASSFLSFNPISSILLGNTFYSKDWVLTRERNGFDLRKIPNLEPIHCMVHGVDDIFNVEDAEISLKLLANEALNLKQANTLYFDAEKCQFPLLIRTWKTGDKMQPLGLNGHKKISDILTDKKVSTTKRKSKLVVLDATNTILAILPDVCSEVHKISQQTSTALAICLKYH